MCWNLSIFGIWHTLEILFPLVWSLKCDVLWFRVSGTLRQIAQRMRPFLTAETALREMTRPTVPLYFPIFPHTPSERLYFLVSSPCASWWITNGLHWAVNDSWCRGELSARLCGHKQRRVWAKRHFRCHICLCSVSFVKEKKRPSPRTWFSIRWSCPCFSPHLVQL